MNDKLSVNFVKLSLEQVVYQAHYFLFQTSIFAKFLIQRKLFCEISGMYIDSGKVKK